MSIQLDQNAGIPMTDECLQIYQQYSRVNNMNGFSDEKRQLQNEVKDKYDQLSKLLGYDKIVFNTGATESIKLILNAIPDVCCYSNQHHVVDEYKNDIQSEDNCCLICYVDPSDSSIRFDQLKNAGKKFQHIILDVSQAVGKIQIPKQSDGIACIFFSCHKLGGPFSTGFMCMSNQFYGRFLKHSMRYNGTFNVPGFMSAAESVISQTLPQRKGMIQCFQKLHKILSSHSIFKEIKPDYETSLSTSINDINNVFSSIIFQISGVCPRSFQGILENNGVQIGFKTACQSEQTGVLRMSWRNPLDSRQIQIVETKIAETLSQVVPRSQALTGGRKLAGSFLDEINNNKYWLTHHWVGAHDKPPNIDKKYAEMFQPDLLKINSVISLKIPAHNKEHFTEELIIKQKKNDEDFDAQESGIRIKNRRVSKYVWINKEGEFDYELDLVNFQTSKMKVQLSDQVFRSVGELLLVKKRFPQEFQEETKEYEVVYKNYPPTLPQIITVNYDQSKQTDLKGGSTTVDESSEKSESSDWEGTKDGHRPDEQQPDRLVGGKMDPDNIRDKIVFQITSYNLKLLTFVGGNSLSVGILINMDKIYRRGQKPSKFHNPHQLIVQDMTYQNYQNCIDGTILTSMNLMKQIDSQYPVQPDDPNIAIKFNKPTNKFNGKHEQLFRTDEIEDKCIIQQISDTNTEQLKEFIKQHNPQDCVIYLPAINMDEIEKEYGLYNWIIQEGYSYEQDYMEYYDTWSMQYKNDKYIVKFVKSSKNATKKEKEEKEKKTEKTENKNENENKNEMKTKQTEKEQKPKPKSDEHSEPEESKESDEPSEPEESDD